MSFLNNDFRPAFLKLGLVEVQASVPSAAWFEMVTPVNPAMVIRVRTIGVDDFTVDLVWRAHTGSRPVMVELADQVRVRRTYLNSTVSRIKSRMREFNRLAVELNEHLCSTCGCPLQDGSCCNSTACSSACRGGASARLKAAFGATHDPLTQAAMQRVPSHAPVAPAAAAKLVQREADSNHAEEPVYSKVPPPELRGLF